jgi:hypothetical protein
MEDEIDVSQERTKELESLTAITEGWKAPNGG